MNERKNDKISLKNILLLVLVTGLVSMTVIYALISANLVIQNTVDMRGTKWDVHFANLSNPVINGSASVINAPTLNLLSITGLRVNLVKPGDSITYTFDIVNAGDLDATLSYYDIASRSNFVCSSNDQTSANIACNNLIYTLKYTSNNNNINRNDTLLAGETKNLTLTIKYDENATEVPTLDVQITGLDSRFTYSQKLD